MEVSDTPLKQAEDLLKRIKNDFMADGMSVEEVKKQIAVVDELKKQPQPAMYKKIDLVGMMERLKIQEEEILLFQPNSPLKVDPAFQQMLEFIILTTDVYHDRKVGTMEAYEKTILSEL